MKKITLLMLLFVANVAFSQNWHPLGAPALETGSLVSLDVDSDNNVYQAYHRTDGDDEIVVRMYNGESWETLPSPGRVINSPFGSTLKIDDGGTPYIAFLDADNDGKVLVKTYNGTEWENVGDGYLSAGAAQTVRMAINSQGAVMVAFGDMQDSGIVKVMSFNGTDWDMVGSTDPSLNGSVVTDLKLNSEDTPYLACVTVGFTFQSSVIKFNGTDWEVVDETGMSEEPVLIFSLAINSDDEVYAGGAKIYTSEPAVFRLNGTEWEAVIVEGLTAQGANSIEIRFDNEDSLYAVKTNAYGNQSVEVKKLTGILWENVGSNAISNGPTNDWATMVFDNTNRLYVGYQSPTGTIIVSSICPTCPLPSTRIEDMYCGTTVSGFNQLISAIPVPEADMYRFRVSDGFSSEVITRSANQFSIKMLSVYNYNTTYTVDVAVRTVDGWGPYGAACSISTPGPSTTSLSAAYCGITVSEFSANTYADAVPLATSYRFKITNADGSQVVVRNNNLFRINYLPFYDYSTTYDVEVAAMVDGIWGDYGTVCQLTTPDAATTMLKDEFCGAAVGRKTNIVAQAVPLATQYRFRVSDGAAFSQELVRPNNFFRLNQLSAYTFNTTYTVEVAAKVDGVWQAYGAACTVSYTTAGRMNMSDELDIETNISAYPNPFESVFSIAIETESTESVHITAYDITGKQLEDINVSPENIGNVKIGDRFAAGIYTIIATQGEYNKTFKVVKK